MALAHQARLAGGPQPARPRGEDPARRGPAGRALGADAAGNHGWPSACVYGHSHAFEASTWRWTFADLGGSLCDAVEGQSLNRRIAGARQLLDRIRTPYSASR